LLAPIYELNGWDGTRACYAHVSGFEEEGRLQTILNWAMANAPAEGQALLPLTDEMRRKLLRTMDLE